MSTGLAVGNVIRSPVCVAGSLWAVRDEKTPCFWCNSNSLKLGRRVASGPMGGGGVGVVWGGQPALLLSKTVLQVGSLELSGLGL